MRRGGAALFGVYFAGRIEPVKIERAQKGSSCMASRGKAAEWLENPLKTSHDPRDSILYKIFKPKFRRVSRSPSPPKRCKAQGWSHVLMHPSHIPSYYKADALNIRFSCLCIKSQLQVGVQMTNSGRVSGKMIQQQDKFRPDSIISTCRNEDSRQKQEYRSVIAEFKRFTVSNIPWKSQKAVFKPESKN